MREMKSEVLVSVVVSCGVCGGRQQIEREFDHPEVVKMVCHFCEALLTVEITEAGMRVARRLAASGNF
jgi:hypothetical protein